MTDRQRATLDAALAPDPWGEADAVEFEAEARWCARRMAPKRAARYRRAAQRARGVTVTEEGR